MKNSYFQTPRRSEDCTWHSWADPIHRDDVPSQNDPDRLVVAACVAIFAAVVVMALVGWIK